MNRATQIVVPPNDPRLLTVITQWLLHIPIVHPFWSQYMLGIASLRDIPGWPPAHKQYAAAAYEFTVCALDPSKNPDPNNRETWQPLSPINYVQQFDGVTDEQAARIGEYMAGCFVEGRLFVEPSGITGARQLFLDVFQATKLKVLDEASISTDADWLTK